jgi:hypothetical protein
MVFVQPRLHALSLLPSNYMSSCTLASADPHSLRGRRAVRTGLRPVPLLCCPQSSHTVWLPALLLLLLLSQELLCRPHQLFYHHLAVAKQRVCPLQPPVRTAKSYRIPFIPRFCARRRPLRFPSLAVRHALIAQPSLRLNISPSLAAARLQLPPTSTLSPA